MYIQIVMYNYFNGKTSMNALCDRLLSQGLSVVRLSLDVLFFGEAWRPFAHQIQLGDAPSSVPLDDSFRLNS